ncbi:tetratricopeptide repeat protein [Aromatoleum anaerobium]|uniref:tetratricopeptide repeat protein n=1 Tax=Aromatoleum anaerobium TaxID=182180 RepID=UPI001FF63A27|nr:hypothetical protein [Aromatoleum anaerobium]MCK0506609.1 hypothetical protein [Aromatoleum anaerobium]
MDCISLNTVSSLSGLSKRTLWRRVADGLLRTQTLGAGERTLVALDDALALSRLRLEPDDRELIREADAGIAEAQCDLALLFLAQNLPEEAVRWLEPAAQQNCPEAMHWLGRCHIAGTGAPADEKAGMEWIARAASRGHATAPRMIQYHETRPLPPRDPAALEAALDAIDREVVLRALNETAHPAHR